MKNQLLGSSPVEAKYTVEQMRVMVMSYLAEKSGVKKTAIKSQHSLQQDLSLDSLDGVILIGWCEKMFGIFIPDDKAENLNTVGDLFRVIENLGVWLKD